MPDAISVSRPTFKRINVDDPEELARRIRNGAIWTIPQFWQLADDAIASGLVSVADCKNLPPQIAEAFASAAQ